MVLTGKCVTPCGLAVFTGLFEFVAYKALDAAIGMHRLIQFTKKSGGGRGRLQILRVNGRCHPECLDLGHRAVEHFLRSKSAKTFRNFHSWSPLRSQSRGWPRSAGRERT